VCTNIVVGGRSVGNVSSLGDGGDGGEGAKSDGELRIAIFKITSYLQISVIQMKLTLETMVVVIVVQLID